MKAIVAMILLFSAQAYGQAVTVEYHWTQPDSTQVTMMISGQDTTMVAGQPMRDGWLKHYNVYMLTNEGMIQVATVPAPLLIADTVYARLPVPLQLAVRFATAAVDSLDREGALSLPSASLTIYPGPAAAPGTPVPAVVYVGGP